MYLLQVLVKESDQEKPLTAQESSSLNRSMHGNPLIGAFSDKDPSLSICFAPSTATTGSVSLLVVSPPRSVQRTIFCGKKNTPIHRKTAEEKRKKTTPAACSSSSSSSSRRSTTGGIETAGFLRGARFLQRGKDQELVDKRIRAGEEEDGIEDLVEVVDKGVLRRLRLC